jgi:CHASE3 domain sensor protein
MLGFMMLLFVLLVIMFLIQYRSYNHSHKKVLSDDTPLAEECDNTLQTSRETEIQE